MYMVTSKSLAMSCNVNIFCGIRDALIMFVGACWKTINLKMGYLFKGTAIFSKSVFHGAFHVKLCICCIYEFS